MRRPVASSPQQLPGPGDEPIRRAPKKASRPFGALSLFVSFLTGVACAVLYLRKPTSDEIPNPKNVERALKAPITKEEKSFMTLGKAAGTDKVAALSYLDACRKDDATCTRPSCTRLACRPWGHYYQTMYQQRLGKYSLPGAGPFQFLEIGYVSATRVLSKVERMP